MFKNDKTDTNEKKAKYEVQFFVGTTKIIDVYSFDQYTHGGIVLQSKKYGKIILGPGTPYSIKPL